VIDIRNCTTLRYELEDGLWSFVVPITPTLQFKLTIPDRHSVDRWRTGLEATRNINRCRMSDMLRDIKLLTDSHNEMAGGGAEVTSARGSGKRRRKKRKGHGHNSRGRKLSFVSFPKLQLTA
jgi:hypothetical protein